MEARKKQLRVMQIASHGTNVGDGANITGFQKVFKEDFSDYEVKFINEEIMDYKPHIGEKDFNSEQFISYANSVDLIIIGGGGFFSAFKRFVNTACHADFTIDTLDKIYTPIVYYALGYAVYYNQPYFNGNALEMLLEYSRNRKNMMISLRNDGSFKRMHERISDKSLMENVDVIPDCGFYVPVSDYHHPELEPNKTNIIIQLAGDKLEYRFKEQVNFLSRVKRKLFGIENARNQKIFLQRMADVIVELSKNKDVNFIVAPHIFHDLGIAYKLISLLPLSVTRHQLNVSNILRGCDGARYFFDLYRKSDLVIGARFHANVCAIGLGTPVVGLVSHDQLDGLYDELGLDTYCSVNDQMCGEQITKLANGLLSCAQNQEILEKLRGKTKAFHGKIEKMLKV